MEEEDEDEDEELDEDVFAPVGGMDIRGSGAGAGAHEEYGGPMDFAFQSRSYDDEDAFSRKIPLRGNRHSQIESRRLLRARAQAHRHPLQ
jgi:hypothetical protein